MTNIDRAHRLEMYVRAIFLADEREESFFAWVDAGLTRLALEDAENKLIEGKYGTDN